MGAKRRTFTADTGDRQIPRREDRRGYGARVLAALKVSGTIRVPGDKSISHRALILAVLAYGESTIRGILDYEDVNSTAGVLRALGASVPALSQSFVVRGSGIRGLRQPRSDLQCGNSGTTTRLMAGVVAAHP